MAEEENKIYTSFLGTGWGFPPTFTRGNHGVGMISDEEDIRSSIQILLDTTVGERVMEPTYGCNLYKLLFEPLNATTATIFRNMIERAILLFEPRVKIENIRFEQVPNEGMLLCHLHWRIVTTNTRYNYVYPFYLNEGTDI
jgi:phage baseplate assembly protein W